MRGKREKQQEGRLGWREEGLSWGMGAEKFAFYSAGREESQNTYGFKSLGCKTAFSASNSYVQSSHRLIAKKPFISDPRAPASAV